MTTANMTTPQGCSPEPQPWRVVTGTTHLYLKGPEFDVTCKRYMNATDDEEAARNLGKVAASLNSHQALVEALGDLLHFCELAHHDSAILTAARAALALSKGGNRA